MAGKLEPDAFASRRLAPLPGVRALLTLFSREHNRIAEQLAARSADAYADDQACFEQARPPPAAALLFRPRSPATAHPAPQARLCNIALFIGVLNHAYVGGIMGDVGALDTRVMAAPHPPHASRRLTPMHGSIEFNLMCAPRSVQTRAPSAWRPPERLPHVRYRFHSTIGESFLLERADADADGELSEAELMAELARVTADLAARSPEEFDVAAALRDAMTAPSGAFAARNTPRYLRRAEAAAIEAGRRFGVARLNDDRPLSGPCRLR